MLENISAIVYVIVLIFISIASSKKKKQTKAPHSAFPVTPSDDTPTTADDLPPSLDNTGIDVDIPIAQEVSPLSAEPTEPADPLPATPIVKEHIVPRENVQVATSMQSRLSDIAVEQPDRFHDDATSPHKAQTFSPMGKDALHFDYDALEEKRDEQVERVMQGIIFAEILTRPSNRKFIWQK